MQPLSSFLVSLNASGFLRNAFLVPLFLVVGDFFTGVASSLKNGTFDFSKFADIMGKDSELLKYLVGALTLFLANSLHFMPPELNVVFATGGVGAISIVILNSIIENLIELLPKADQPIAQAIVSGVEQEVQSVLQAGAVTPPPSVGIVKTVDAPVLAPLENQATTSLPVTPAPAPGAPVLSMPFTMPSGL